MLMRYFFSSRRRHTSLQGDWSSDVCSSDLLAVAGRLDYLGERGGAVAVDVCDHDHVVVVGVAVARGRDRQLGERAARVEIGRASCRERGVGSECEGTTTVRG